MSDAIPTFGEPEPGVDYVLRPGAYVVLRDDRGHIVVVRDGGAHYLPGGGIHEGETAEQAAARECREECALEVRIGRFLGSADDLVFGAPEGTHFRKRCSYFAGEIVRSIPGLVPEHELLWLPLNDARSLLTHGSQRWVLGLDDWEHGASARRCPRCGQAAQRGALELRPSFWDFFRMYLSNLAYVPDSTEYGHFEMIRGADRRVAYRCYRCGVVIVTPTPWTSL